MLKLLNKDRKIHKLPKLRMQQDLRDVARKHSKDMAEKDYFDHVNLKRQTPKDRMQMSRVTEALSGENLAKIGGFVNPTQKAEIGLMNSPGHRANILNKHYNCVGIGVIQSVSKIYYFTQNFAKRYIIFKKRIPKKTRLKKGLKLKGYCTKEIPAIYYQLNKFKEVKKKKLIKLSEKNFEFIINFPEHGEYRVDIFVPDNPLKKNKFILSNHFEIYVKKGLFF